MQVELFYAKIRWIYVRWLSLGLFGFCLSVKYRHWFNTFPFHLHSHDVVNSDGPAGLPSVKNFCTDSESNPILTAPIPLLPVLEVSTESFSPGYPATHSTHLCLQKISLYAQILLAPGLEHHLSLISGFPGVNTYVWGELWQIAINSSKGTMRNENCVFYKAQHDNSGQISCTPNKSHPHSMLLILLTQWHKMEKYSSYIFLWQEKFVKSL